MTDRIRVGIVGATVTPGGSGWGATAHVPALRALPEYHLKAVCTAHPDTAQASAERFGADLAFSNFDEMVAHPDIDLVAVVVRVPKHHDLVMKALDAGKHVMCEWPLGATLDEAERMANLASARSLRTLVGLQAHSDATLTYARELIQQGFVGDVLTVNYIFTSQAVTQRGNGRIWQSDRRNGANTLTIAAGHALEALCFVLSEFDDVSARLATTIPEWHNTDTGETVRVDSPDWISVSGHLQNGGETTFLVATAPANASGTRFEIFGTEGTLVIAGGSLSQGPNKVLGARGKDALAPTDTPAHFTVVPPDLPAGPPRNVGQAYVRFASAFTQGQACEPDFRRAVVRHRLIAAIEQSAAEGRAMRVEAPALTSA